MKHVESAIQGVTAVQESKLHSLEAALSQLASAEPAAAAAIAANTRALQGGVTHALDSEHAAAVAGAREVASSTAADASTRGTADTAGAAALTTESAAAEAVRLQQDVAATVGAVAVLEQLLSVTSAQIRADASPSAPLDAQPVGLLPSPPPVQTTRTAEDVHDSTTCRDSQVGATLPDSPSSLSSDASGVSDSVSGGMSPNTALAQAMREQLRVVPTAHDFAFDFGALAGGVIVPSPILEASARVKATAGVLDPVEVSATPAHSNEGEARGSEAASRAAAAASVAVAGGHAQQHSDAPPNAMLASEDAGTAPPPPPPPPSPPSPNRAGAARA
ncbi:hypothetical protein EON68_02940, partial [archaeon]